MLVYNKQFIIQYALYEHKGKIKSAVWNKLY